MEYKIPSWCGMPKDYHEDGVGGCWGISYGYVEKKGENCCKNCGYRKEPLNAKKEDENDNPRKH